MRRWLLLGFFVSGKVTKSGAIIGNDMRYTMMAFHPPSFGNAMEIGGSPSSSSGLGAAAPPSGLTEADDAHSSLLYCLEGVSFDAAAPVDPMSSISLDAELPLPADETSVAADPADFS